MKVFTYNKYIKCIHTLRLNAVLQLAEEGEEYYFENETNKYLNSELIKNILREKEEAISFINFFIEPKNHIIKDELEIYTNNYINKKYKSKEADLIYKLKGQDIFFLIEHQSTIDNSIKYRMLNYCIDIIQEWSRNKKIGRNVRYPIVVPIVIYTGDRKWKVQKKYKEKQMNTYIFERNNIDLEYNLVDINKISKQTLFEQNTIFGYIMLIEKSQTKEELIDNLSFIIKSIDDKERLNKIASIMKYLLNNLVEEGTVYKIIKDIDRKVGNKDMSTLYDRLLAENKEILKKGKIQGKKEIVKKMIDKEFDDQIILEITGIKKEDLKKLKTTQI